KAEKSIMVGNKFSEDILGAVNVGMSVILVNSKLTEAEERYIEKEGIKLDIVSDISEVKEIL
ncbi:MAG TPA: HAD hydrolase-like protein, partial [Methanobacterium sp.]